MIHYCPNCHTERPLSELFCEGEVAGTRCNWTLSDEPIRPEGWQPPKVVTTHEIQAAHQAVCTNGHALSPGDLICTTCGADRADPTTSSTERAHTPSLTTCIEQETSVEGWRLIRQISSTPRVRDRFLAQRDQDGRTGVLTLYHHGAEPDPAIYEVIRRLSRDYVPELIATGRWDDRAFEVAEEISGGTLSDLGIVATHVDGIRHILSELGPALHAFSEVGLRHRDIRPATILVRNREPLDIVIGGFGSARLSDFDLDVVSPLEVTRYMAPEAVAGGVAAASDWWSLGILLLEQITKGACFEGIDERAYLIHVLASGVSLPSDLHPSLDLLLRGLLARNRHERWQWKEVSAWLAGEQVAAPERSSHEDEQTSGASIELGGRAYRQLSLYALAAANAANWEQAREHLTRGALTTWMQHADAPAEYLAGIRHVLQQESLDEDSRLMLALKVLNPEMPLIHQGNIVTPRWLLEHPVEGYDLISGPVPDLLKRLGAETWLTRMKARAQAVRQRAQNLNIDVDEDSLRVLVLTTSRARLATAWEERRRLLPETTHHGLQSIAERALISEEDLIVLLSAAIGLFTSCDQVVEDAAALAINAGVSSFNRPGALQLVALPRPELIRRVSERTAGFARTEYQSVNDWADQFRIERRIAIARALVILAVPQAQWQEPQKQQYVSQILDFFEKRISATVMRGPLARMVIGKSTARVDLHELGTDRVPAHALLDHLLQRTERALRLDPSVFDGVGNVEERLVSVMRHTTLYKRDTGIDGLYLGFPFLLAKDAKGSTRTRIAPLLLWPVRLQLEVGSRGEATLGFDNEREEVRINPALDTLLGAEAAARWRSVAEDLLRRSSFRTADVMDAFGVLTPPRSLQLRPVPGPGTTIPKRTEELECSAVLFHVTFIGQAIGEDLRNLKGRPPAGTGLETALRLGSNGRLIEPHATDCSTEGRELERYFTVDSDPSQEIAVMQARRAPGVLIEGPPGTGKSQTIVNIVGDAIGRRQSLLVICQKHAALEVVYKRLTAEGLGDRIVLVNDVNRDRGPIIKAVREQVEALHRRREDPTLFVRRKRESVSARIEALEAELDRHHTAIHRVDDRIGLSYRQVLGELIDLEEPRAPLDLPAWRQPLQKIDLANLASLEEEIAPLARYWLPARYEGSALADLRSFAADQATLLDFNEAFLRFTDDERARTEVLLARPCEFDVDDPAPHRAWLAAYGKQLLALPDLRRTQLARWLPLFRPAAADSVGFRLIGELERLVAALDACQVGHHDKTLSTKLASRGSSQIKALIDTGFDVLSHVSWWKRIGMRRFLRRRRIMRFLKAMGETADKRRLEDLVRAAQLEQNWRPLRVALSKIHKQLQLPTIAEDAGPTLSADARATLGAIKSAGEFARRLALAPDTQRVDAAAAVGTRDALLRLIVAFDAAFARHAVRTASMKGLHSLAGWMSDAWLAAAKLAIARNEPLQSRIDPIVAALPTLAPYQLFRGRAQRLSARALEILAILRTKEPLLDAVPVAQLEAQVRRILNREARLGWKHQLEQVDPHLHLEREEIESKVASLAQLDREMRALNRQLLKDDFDAPQIKRSSDWEDITRLTGQRARRLREFIELGAPLGLLKLRPIWLMNPDVASRVLPLKPGLFDAVVYDEASQMPVEYSLPTLFRARVTIVSGDEKQMPPTAFFASKVENDEAEAFDGELPDEDATEEEREAFDETWNRREIKDCPDLLQLARTNLPNASLQIHYRSAYRELIGYSNACFYGNGLSVPVRHPEATIREAKPIEVIHVNGVYRDQTNAGEAERVVQVVADLWKQTPSQRPTVGIVTFNRKQADLIEDFLERRAEEDALFRETYRQERERIEEGEDMAVFVKNVENVQGDERDVIIFSSTFGRNAQGTFRRAFGVLGQRGGERRLNVAVTRARRKIVMITSMPIAEVSDFLNTHRPPSSPRDFLQGYLEYARAVSAGEFESSRSLLQRMTIRKDAIVDRGHDRTTDGFSASVAKYVVSLGYKISKSTDDDAFGLDFAIEDPATGLFAVGIECDAPRHELLVRARAREVWRPTVLTKAVPRVHRVSCHAWYHHTDDEQKRLRDVIYSTVRQEESA